MIKNTCLSVLVLLFLSSCSLIPAPLEVESDVVLVPYREANNNIDAMARWGGQIASVAIEADYTVLDVVQMDLNTTARPKNKNESAGRFKVYYKGLLDPLIYKKGKNITALGTINEPIEGNIGELVYSFPVLVVKNVYLWDDAKNVSWAVGYDPFYRSRFYGRSYNYGYNYGYGYSRKVKFKRSRSSRYYNRRSH